MLALQIDNGDIENIFLQGFAGNKERFFEFIRKSYQDRESFAVFQQDKMRFQSTYEQMIDGNMEMLSQEDADEEIDRFLERL